MLAAEEAVVGGEDDVGVIEDALVLQLLDELADRLVDRDQLLLLAPPLGVDQLRLLLADALLACFWSHFGLSLMSFSLKPGSFGSGVAGVPEEVARRGSKGPCGELNQTFILNGCLEALVVDEVDRLVAEHVGLVIARLVAVEGDVGRRRRAGLLDQLVVEVEGVLGDLAVPLGPALRDRQVRSWAP